MRTTIEMTEQTKYALFYPATGEWFAANQTGGYAYKPNTTKDILKAKMWEFKKLASNAEGKDTYRKAYEVQNRIQYGNGDPYCPTLQAGVVRPIIVTLKFEEEI